MLRAISSAQHHVHLETYILASDSIGDRFSDALLERAPTARKVVLPGAGHEIPSEQPEALTRSIHQFLGELAQ